MKPLALVPIAVLLAATACHHNPATNCDAGSCPGVGSNCAQDSDCAALGSGAICKVSTPSGVAYPSGYCTLPCPNSSCPTGSSCLDFSQLTAQYGVNSYGESTAFCLSNCNSDLDCASPDYVCLGGNTPDSTNTTFNAGLGCFINVGATNQTGQPCTTLVSCAFPPTNGYCLTETDSTGVATGFIGGYCSSSCLGVLFTSPNPDSFCGSGARCLVDGMDTSGNPNSANCYSLCPSPGSGQSSCRSSYLCLPVSLPDGGQDSQGVCYIPCQFAGCATGTTCQASGYCL
jgi:hypothetical protein